MAAAPKLNLKDYPSSTYRSHHSDMDFDQIVYAQERDLYGKITMAPWFSELTSMIETHFPESEIRRNLMRDHLRLDLSLSPKVREAIEVCKKD